MRASEAANVKKRWREQHDDVLFPDEVRLQHPKLHMQASICHHLSFADPDTSTGRSFMGRDARIFRFEQPLWVT